jgi:hypothetical protein
MTLSKETAYTSFATTAKDRVQGEDHNLALLMEAACIGGSGGSVTVFSMWASEVSFIWMEMGG